MTQKEFQKIILGPEVKVHGYTYEQLTWQLFPSSFTAPHDVDDWTLGLLKLMMRSPEEDLSGWRAHLARRFPALDQVSHETFFTVYMVLNEVAATLYSKKLQGPLPAAFRRYLKE